jgi:hypothetical protein
MTAVSHQESYSLTGLYWSLRETLSMNHTDRSSRKNSLADWSAPVIKRDHLNDRLVPVTERSSVEDW